MTPDIIIVVLYFLLILAVGLWTGRNVKSMDEFSVGNRAYTAPIIFATLSASFIGGGFTNGLADKVFHIGILYVVALWGFSLKEILVAKIIAPRLGAFRKAITVGDMMGDLYGSNSKIFTGIASTLVCAGIAGAQFAAFGYLLNILTGLDAKTGIILGTAMVVAYAAFGGIKSVVANDVIHFGVLIIAIPLVIIFGLFQVGGIETLLASVPEKNLSFNDELTLVSLIALFLSFFFGETLVPPYVQRLLIGKDLDETAKGTLWSGLLSIPFFLGVGCIGLIALVLNPSIDSSLAMPYVIDQVMPIGLKGLAIAGMMAVIMSSADSFLNAAAISMTHDIIKPVFKSELSKKLELFLSRLTTVIIGVVGAGFAISTKSAIDILLVAYNFWTPFILVPLVGGILGYKLSRLGFWLSSFSGIIVTLGWLYYMQKANFDGAIIGIMVNLIVFMTFLKIKKFTNKRGEEFSSYKI
jgi:SSS family solute:Na+ symporter